MNSKSKNLIIGRIFRYPSMNSTEFIDIYISELLQKTSKEDKSITLISDFDKDTNADSATNLDLNFKFQISSPLHFNLNTCNNTI